MGIIFQATVEQAEGKNATGIRVPPDVIEALGSGKRPKVTVQIGGYQYRSTVAASGEAFMLPLAAEHREAAGVRAGDAIEVTLALDVAPRTVDLPEDLSAALAAQPGAMAAFEGLPFSARKEHVRQVETAKAQETRERRIAAIVAKLGG